MTSGPGAATIGGLHGAIGGLSHGVKLAGPGEGAQQKMMRGRVARSEAGGRYRSVGLSSASQPYARWMRAITSWKTWPPPEALVITAAP